MVKYSEAIWVEILLQIAEGKSLRKICEQKDMPDKSNVLRWIMKDKDKRDQYARAKAEGAEAMAEDILDIADDGTNDWMTIEKNGMEIEVPNREVIDRSKLRVEARKWLMSKILPKKYGELQKLIVGGDSQNPLNVVVKLPGLPPSKTPSPKKKK